MSILEFIFFILAFIGIFTVMIFIYSKFIRLLKKKSHHYIVRPKPDKDPNKHPIDIAAYNQFIFIKDSDEKYFFEKLNRFLGVEDPEEEKKYQEFDEETTDESKFEYFNNRWDKVIENEFSISINDIGFYKYDKWFILNIKHGSFLDFHSLVWWLVDHSFIYNTPSDVIGFCQSKKRSLDDYIVKIDMESSEDDFIGSFRTHQNFGIYLPNAGLEESGNISLTRNHEINFYSELSKLPIKFIDKKMIPYEKVENYYRQQKI